MGQPTGAALVLSALLATLVSCGGSASIPIDATSFLRPYSYLPNARPTGGWDEFWPQATYIIQNTTQLRTAWVGREYSGRPFGEPPSLDFSKEMLLGVSKPGGSACAELRVTRVLEVSGELTVESQLRSTSPTGAACTFDFVPLFDFVWVPQSNLPVRFLPTTIAVAK
ncbi:MAG: hypothetical protein CFE43_08930 [Burkholderiales bacterium PBB3]|nr:MAG: hypothetical protein CFE43_08930 [Burkholderiales bacterium PBB3]